MKKSRMLSFLPFAMAGLLLAPSAGFGFNRRDLIPDDTVAVLEISNTSDLVEAFGHTSLGRMWNDPQIRQFLGRPVFSELLRATLFESDEKNVEKSKLLWDALLMLNGEMILAFPASFEAFAPTIVAAMTEKDFLRSLDMDRRIAELTTDKTFTIRRHQFQGIDLIQHIEESHEGPEKKITETWQAFTADTLVYGPSRDWVEKSLVRLKQQKPSMPAGLAPSLKLRLNIPALLRKALEEEERKAGPSAMRAGIPSLKNVFTALGLMTVGELSLTASIHPDRTDVEASLPVADMSKGLFSVFDTRPSSPNLRVPFVPATAYGYAVSRANLAALFRQVPAMVKEAAPEMAAQIDMGWAMMDMFLGISLERDLLAHFDTQIVSFSSVADRRASDVVAIRLNNEGQVKNALAKMFADGGQVKTMLASVLSEEEFLGAKLYKFATAPTGETMPFGGPAVEPAPLYAVAVDSGYFLYGSELGVRHAVRALNSAVAETGFYDSAQARKLLATVPPRAYQYSVNNWAEFSKAAVDIKLYTQFQAWAEEAARETIADDPSSAWARFLAKVDFTRWPTIGHVTSFLGPSFDYAVRDDGVLRTKTIFYHENKTSDQ